MIRKCLTPVALLAVASLAGCQALAYGLYTLFPFARERAVPAECRDLEGKTTAIVIYCTHDTLYEHPRARLTVALTVGEQIGKEVKDAHVVDPYRVVKYQDENIYWDSMPKTELAKAFGADRLLYVTLIEYSTRDPGSLNLYRGRITAEAAVYDATRPEREARLWRATDLRVLYPPNDPSGVPEDNDRAIRERTEQEFADLLAKKFYKHEVPLE